MSFAKPALASSLVALALTGCASTAVHSGPAGSSRGRVDDPRTAKSNHVACLRGKGLPVQEVGQTGIQVGSPPAGPHVVFEPTAGVAQGEQVNARVQGAEVIGSALLYPNHASDAELNQIETCLAQGVSG